jgi:hypothetical protein
MNLKKNGKVFTSKFVGTGPSSYGKRMYQTAVSQRLRNTDLEPSSGYMRIIKLETFASTKFNEIFSGGQQLSALRPIHT